MGNVYFHLTLNFRIIYVSGVRKNSQLNIVRETSLEDRAEGTKK